jgi:putative acyl-CoA dehydrogenase
MEVAVDNTHEPQGTHPALRRLAAALPLRVDNMSTETAGLQARRLAQDVALAVRAALFYQTAPAAVFGAICDLRLAGNWGHAFGTPAAGVDFETIIDRAMPHQASPSTHPSR